MFSSGHFLGTGELEGVDKTWDLGYGGLYTKPGLGHGPGSLQTGSP